MCGITGCLALADGAGPDTEWVGRAAMRIAHRGPDDEAFFADQHLALGFRRLAVIDTSAAGRQPMQSADGRFVLVFDGEIDSAYHLLEELPYLPAVEWPAQSDLDAILATLVPQALPEAA